MVLAALFIAEGYATLGKVIGAHFNSHFVAGQDLDVVHTHLAGDVGNDFVAAFKFYAEHCVREGFDDGAVEFDC